MNSCHKDHEWICYHVNVRTCPMCSLLRDLKSKESQIEGLQIQIAYLEKAVTELSLENIIEALQDEDDIDWLGGPVYIRNEEK